MSSENTLPEGWEETTLGAFTTWKKGKKPQEIVDTPRDDLLPYLVADYLRNGTATQFASQEKVVLAEEGQCVLLWDGAGAGDSFSAPEKGVVASTMAVGQVSDSSIDRFVLLLVMHKRFEIAAAARGSTVPHVDRGHLEGLTVSLPPIDEQQRIVDLVTTADNYITDLKAEHTAAIQARKSLVEELLQPKESWEETTVGAIATFDNGFAFKPAHLDGSTTPVVRIKQLLDDSAEIDMTDLTDGEVPEKNVIDTGNLIFSWSATLAVRTWTRGPAYLNQHLFKVTPKDVALQDMVALILEGAIPELAGKSHGSTMKHIRKGDLVGHEVTLPPLDEQQRIVDLVTTADNYITDLKAEIEAAEATRKSLVDDLLTGRVRLTAATTVNSENNQEQ